MHMQDQRPTANVPHILAASQVFYLQEGRLRRPILLHMVPGGRYANSRVPGACLVTTDYNITYVSARMLV